MKCTAEITSILNPKEFLNTKCLRVQLDNLYKNLTVQNLNNLANYIVKTTYNYLNAVYYNDEDFFKHKNFQKLFKQKHLISNYEKVIPKFTTCEKELAEYFAICRENKNYRKSFYNKQNFYFSIDEQYLADLLKNKLQNYIIEMYTKDNKLNWFIKHDLFSMLILKTFLYNGNRPYAFNTNDIYSAYSNYVDRNYLREIKLDIMACPKNFKYFRHSFDEWAEYGFMTYIISA